MTIAEPRFEEQGAPHDEPEPDVGAMFGELGDDARIMLDRDLALARAELGLTARHARSAGVGFGAAAVIGYLALGSLAVAAGLGLSEVVHPAIAFLIVALVLAAGAGTCVAVGRKNLEALDPVPHHTIENIKEDLAWLRARMS